MALLCNMMMMMIRTLVGLGADPSATTLLGSTAIFTAAAKGQVEAIRTLVSLGVDPSATTLQGQTAIFAAADTGHVDAMRTLVSLGADRYAEARLRRGLPETALTFATQRGHTAAARWLG